MSEQYARIKKEVDDDDNVGRENERALLAKDWHPPQLKGTCHKRGRYSHKGAVYHDDGQSRFPKMAPVDFVRRKDIGYLIIRSSKRQELSLIKLI